MSKESEKGKPFPASALADAFVSRSQNNSGFLVAALRAEGLLKAAPSQPMMSILAGDLDAWAKKVKGLPLAKGKPVDASVKASSPNGKDADTAKKASAKGGQ